MVAELSAALIAQVTQAAKILARQRRICILTGAGISAESGIPTFRDKQTGLWAHYRAEDLANPHAFARDPKMVWSWYQWRRRQVADKRPNPAHIALATWQRHAVTQDQHLTIITQNVDDLHEQAGSRVTHLHGHLWRNRCHDCQTPYDETAHHEDRITSASDNTDANGNRDYTAEARYLDDALLTCPQCSGVIRPDIVWFGEALPQQEWQIAEQAAAQCTVFISIGTSSLVYPAAGLSQTAKQHGATLIEINPNPTLTRDSTANIDIILAAKAGLVLPLLVEHILKERASP